jgi:outer membrane protein
VIVESTSALAASQLKSQLDVSFAKVGLEQARLLLLDAETRVNAAFADLSAALGYRDPHRFILSEDTLPSPVSNALATLLSRALLNRPDAAAAHYALDSALKRASAEKVAGLPRVDLIGVLGRTPAGDPSVRESYAAAGFNVQVPLFTGGRITARAREVALEADAASKAVEETEEGIVRDVNQAWLNVNEEKERIEVTQRLLQSATEALELAQARYQTGLASFLEYSQADLNKTQAQIDNATATYQYEIMLSVLDFQTGAAKYSFANKRLNVTNPKANGGKITLDRKSGK